MSYLLRIFAIETLLSFVTEYLISTIKNPHSANAYKVRNYVIRLQGVVNEFLDRTDPNKPFDPTAGAATRVV